MWLVYLSMNKQNCLLIFISLTNKITVMIQSFRTNRFGQTVQTQICEDPDQTAPLKKQSDGGLHCSLLHLHLFDEIP